ncbi:MULTISPECIES: patatin-like phospholipase family protein [unclassified Xanthobacter]|uniref:patatin-like phospholipase family protein n=1 Tax=unclassified Xanthobacter TaxID=2623496 RepID=UPI001EDE4951|nr:MULTISPECIES: patatin-like phospholipase family protein [unclassified Xanthobacter]
MFQAFHRGSFPSLNLRGTPHPEAPPDEPANAAPEAQTSDPAPHPDLDAGPPRSPARDPRPALGLALGGGAARGFAHIGMLRVLEREGIRPGVVTGTSIGAVVGGLWAAGRLDELEEWARGLTKRNVLGFLDFALGGAGLIGGRRLSDLMRRKMGEMNIEDLPLAFGAIATELGTGHEIWLTRGDLVEALRASYALPGIFTPVKVGGRWLMDGALVNPVPVSPARALGARVVLAVNLNSEVFGRGTVIHDHGGVVGHVTDAALTGKKQGFAARLSPNRLRRHFFAASDDDGPRGLSSVMIDAFNITQDRISRSRLAGDPPDVTVSPKLGSIGLFDFHKADEAIAAGAEAAERSLEDIRAALAVFA